MKKKLLYLSQCFPLPLDGGGKIKTFNTINTLAHEFDIYAVFVSEREATDKDLTIFKKIGVKTKIFQTDLMSEDIKKNYLKLFWNYLQLRPHFVYQYRYLPAFSFIKEKIKSWQPDVIHVDHVNSSQFLPAERWLAKNLINRPVLILENHNINHLLFKSRFHESKKLIRKIYLLMEGSLNLFYELINYPRYDHIFTISDDEKKILEKHNLSVHTQPLVYPLPKSPVGKKKKCDILFIGYLQWPPNEIALNWFINKIMPKLLKKIPEAKLHVVGKGNNDIYKFKNKNVIFYGYQKKLDHFLSSSKIFVLPFKTGAGVRIKSLTALQNGIPIVSTKLGVNGLKLKNKREYLLAETENEFVESIVKLLKDNRLRAKMSKAQKEYYEKNHSLQKNKHFLKKYLKLCA